MGKRQKQRKNPSAKSKPSVLRRPFVRRSPVRGLRGLLNHGSTCYVNAVLQCLSRSALFRRLLEEGNPSKAVVRRPVGVSYFQMCSTTNPIFHQDGVSSLNISLPPIARPVTDALLRVMRELTEITPPISQPPHVNCRVSFASFACSHCFIQPLIDAFLERHPRFSGSGQQDSHEFLRALLDSVKQEELLRWRKGILNALNVNPRVSWALSFRTLVFFCICLQLVCTVYCVSMYNEFEPHSCVLLNLCGHVKMIVYARSSTKE